MVSLPRVKRFSDIPYIPAMVELGVNHTALTDLLTHPHDGLFAPQYYSHLCAHLRKPAFLWKWAQAINCVKRNRRVHENITSASSLAISCVDPVPRIVLTQLIA